MSQNNVVQLQSGAINVEGSLVHIHEIRLDNLDLADYLRNEEDRKEAFNKLMQAALYVRRLSSASAEAEALGAVAEKVRISVEKDGDNTVEEITSLLKSHTDVKNPGGLALILKEAVSKMLTAELSPSNESSPLHDLLKSINQVLEKVTEKVGIDKAEGKSNKKGGDFNRVMHGLVASIGSVSDHHVEYTNDVKSIRGRKLGDSVVTLPSLANHFEPVNIVWEYKAEHDLTLPSVLKELEEAIQNRDAKSGVFVLAREPEYENWPTDQAFSGNRLVIVVDKDDPDIFLIRYAYMWSKLMALKDLAMQNENIDLQKVAHMVDQTELTLKDFRNVTAAHNKISLGLVDAQRWSKSIEDKLKDQLSQVTDLVTSDIKFQEIIAPLKPKER